MEYTYTTLLLAETGAELNERNVTAVLEAAGADVTESRVKATVAALEGVDVAGHAARPDDGDDPGEVEPVVASDDGDGGG